MADDALHLHIPGPLSERIKAAAEESGISAEAFVSRTLEYALDDIEEDLRRLAEPGEDVDAEEAFDRFEAQIKDHLAARK